MRIAVFSDIHGNCLALDAILDNLQHEPADQLVCLGDAIQGGPQPAQVVARLRELACPVVMGNSDNWLLTGFESGGEKIQEARRQKMDADMQFIRHLGRTFHFNPGSVGLAYRHDQPEDAFQLDPWAEYAILSVAGERIDLTFCRVPFDVEALIDVYRRSGRPFAEDAIAEYEEATA